MTKCNAELQTKLDEAAASVVERDRIIQERYTTVPVESFEVRNLAELKHKFDRDLAVRQAENDRELADRDLAVRQAEKFRELVERHAELYAEKYLSLAKYNCRKLAELLEITKAHAASLGL